MVGHLLFFHLWIFSFSFNLLFHSDLCCPQVIAKVHNLMWQRVHFFQRLEVVVTRRVYIAHNMDKNEEVQVGLEAARSEATAAWKLAKEDACLLRKVENEKEASQTEAR